MIRSTAAPAALVLLAWHAPLAAQSRWVTTPADGCAGLTVSWELPGAAVAALAGPRWVVRPGRTPGTALFSYFIVSCSESRIDSARTGGLAAAMPIIPLAGSTDSTLTDVGAAVGTILSAAGSPVQRIFRSNGFEARDGRVTFRIVPWALGFRVIATAGDSLGRIVIEAEVEDSAAAFEADGRLGPLGVGPVATFGGPERSVRYTAATGSVLSEGVTVLSRLGVSPLPARIALDRRFAWNFSFAPPPR